VSSPDPKPRGLAAFAAGLAAVRVPSLKVSAALVLAMLGFGVLVGEAERSSVQDTLLASRRPQLRVIVPARRAPASSSAGESSEASGGGSEAEAPESEAAATPTPAPASTPAPAAAQPESSAPEASREGAGESTAPKPATKLPAIKHVFVIMLSDEPYASVFGPESPAHYLVKQLEPKGALLAHYDAVAHEQLANEIALLSGQGPTLETAANCPTYSAIVPATKGAQGQVIGNGCVYPATTRTLPGELSAKHLTWRAYVEGMGEVQGASTGCARPLLGAPDPGSAPGASGGPYATFINPFLYFSSLSEAPACVSHDVSISRLKHDLASVKRTPSFTYIAPSRCDDGDTVACTAGAPAGLAPTDAFLKRVVPEITSSKAYKRSGLLVITVDEAPSSGAFADSSSCCGQPTFPNLGTLTLTPAGRPRGGGAVGALLLSPFIKGPVTSQEPYNHYSLLATIEDIFNLKHLGYSGLAAVKPVEPGIFIETPGK